MVTMTVTSTMTNLKFGVPLLLGVFITTMVAAFLVQQQQQHQQQQQRQSQQKHRSFSSSSLHDRTGRSANRPLLPATNLHATTTRRGDIQHQNQNKIHLIVLVHGWLGSPNELGYLQEELQRQSLSSSSSSSADSSSSTVTVVHAAECNDGRTSDGIVPGGKRLALEINALVEQLSNEYYHHHHHHRQQQCNLNEEQKQGNKNVSAVTREGSSDDSSSSSDDDGELDITISLVGNSLGGLYARYAVKDIEWGQQQQQQQQNSASSSSSSSSMAVVVKPGQFITTCTPHLGVNKHTYIGIPRFAEEIIGRVLGQTGKDLFQIVDHDSSSTTATKPSSPIIHDMTTNDEYLTPLSNFQRRVAFANAYGTDFQVPTSTAAFWEEHDDSSSLHYEVPRTMNSHRDDNQNDHRTSVGESTPSKPLQEQVQRPQPPPEVVMILQTTLSSSSSSISSSKSESETTVRLSDQLNRLGWTKVVCDVRRHIVTNRLPSLSLFSNSSNRRRRTTESSSSDSRTFTAKELLSLFDTEYGRNIPLGHTIAVANSKDTLNRWITKGGRPIMDYLANDILTFFQEKEQKQLPRHEMKDDKKQPEFVTLNGKVKNKKTIGSKTIRQDTVLRAKRGDNDEEQEEESTNVFGKVMTPFTNSPGGMILFPFVVIFGLDILLNTFFLTKRTFEYFVLGQAPSTDTWF